VLTLDQIATLPELLSRARTSQAKQARVELWDSPYLYALVLGALTAEWAIRKRLGLP
jgi:hypothetical protein